MAKKKTENEKEIKKKQNFEKILDYDKNLGLLIPIKWKYPYLFRKKDYIAIIIGLNNRYEFERIFCDKKEFESDEDERVIGVGFEPTNFKDDLIIEEKYSFKEKNTFVQHTNYYELTIFEDSGEVWGRKLSKTEIKDLLTNKQQLIYHEFKGVMKSFGEDFTLYTMRSILDQRKMLLSKKINLFFFD